MEGSRNNESQSEGLDGLVQASEEDMLLLQGDLSEQQNLISVRIATMHQNFPSCFSAWWAAALTSSWDIHLQVEARNFKGKSTQSAQACATAKAASSRHW